MIIYNIDSQYDLTKSQIDFVENLLICGRHHSFDDEELYFLLKRIPFYLVNECSFNSIKNNKYFIKERRDFPKYDDFEDNRNRPMKSENNDNKAVVEVTVSTEALGYYVSKGRYGTPEIYLCTETIMKNTNDDEELHYLLAKVIVHELAHAWLDDSDYGTKDEFYEWMEESMANLITLFVFRDFDRHFDRHFHHHPYLLPFAFSHNFVKLDYYKARHYVEEFMFKQPDNYKLAVYLLQARFWGSHLWRRCKDEVATRSKRKDDWLNYAKTVASTGILDSEKLNKLTYDLFENDEKAI